MVELRLAESQKDGARAMEAALELVDTARRFSDHIPPLEAIESEISIGAALVTASKHSDLERRRDLAEEAVAIFRGLLDRVNDASVHRISCSSTWESRNSTLPNISR